MTSVFLLISANFQPVKMFKLLAILAVAGTYWQPWNVILLIFVLLFAPSFNSSKLKENNTYQKYTLIQDELAFYTAL